MRGMIWGISFALHEEARFDQRTGRIMNADFVDYHIPVTADVIGLKVITVHEDDPHVSAWVSRAWARSASPARFWNLAGKVCDLFPSQGCCALLAENVLLRLFPLLKNPALLPV